MTILGARRRDLLVFEDRLGEASHELLVCTDDGSYGRKGFVTDVLKEAIEYRRSRGERRRPRDRDRPAPDDEVLLEDDGALRRSPTLVSLNTIMVDGTGMCGGCRVMVDGVARYVCVDGPEFDGHRVDFDGMMRRQAMYKPEEAASLARYREKNHTCRLEAPAAASEAEA